MSARSTVRCLRLPIRTLSRHTIRHNSTTPRPASPRIDEIVSQISTLSVLEVSDLIASLKTKLNITEVAAPVSAAPAAAPAAEAAKPVEQEAEKTVFNLKLESFDASAKAKIIREVKAMLGMNLIDAKKFVESAPKILKEGVTKEDAEKIKKALEAAGGVVKLE